MLTSKVQSTGSFAVDARCDARFRDQISQNRQTPIREKLLIPIHAVYVTAMTTISTTMMQRAR
jgi:hypothetical protein